MEVNKLEEMLYFQICTERFHRGRHQDDVVVEVLVKLLNANWVGRLARDELELQSVIAASHRLYVFEKD